ncbi:MAG: hypothetical protein Q9201_003567 [Fulgogasparrea decipioides]
MTTHSPLAALPPALISLTTVLSLLFFLAVVLLAILLSKYLLPRPHSRQTLLLHTWHLFDFLIHTLFEGSYLYHSLFSHTTLPPTSPDYPHPASLPTSPKAAFLSHPDRAYGAAHSTHPTALLWQEYSRADARWANTDTTIISIELLTVFIAGPLALYICYLLQQPSKSGEGNAANQKWFWMTVLATGEIYGGFMTFAPELMTGNSHLDTGNWMYLWLYLVIFNGLWVVVPGWVLWIAHGEMRDAFQVSDEQKKEKKED